MAWRKDIQTVHPCEAVEFVLGMMVNYVFIRGKAATLEMEPMCFPKSAGCRGQGLCLLPQQELSHQFVNKSSMN